MNKYLLMATDFMLILLLVKTTYNMIGYGTLPETKDIAYFAMTGFIVSIYCFVHRISDMENTP